MISRARLSSLLILATLCCYSCGSKPPPKPKPEHIVGKWILTDKSSLYVKEANLQSETFSIEFKEDGTFTATFDPSASMDKILRPCTGTWQVAPYSTPTTLGHNRSWCVMIGRDNTGYQLPVMGDSPSYRISETPGYVNGRETVLVLVRTPGDR